MRINRRFLTWGVFFIVVGAIPLAVRAGTLTTDQVGSWWNLWPLIVVGIGVGLVLSRTPFEVLGGLLVAVTAGVMAGAFLAVGAQGLPSSVCGNERGSATLPSQTGTFDGPARIDVQLNCGEVTLSGVAGSGWSFEGTGDLEHEPTVRGAGDELEIRSDDDSVSFPITSRREAWQVGVPTDVPFELELQLNAGRAEVAPGAVTLRDVDVQVNFGAVVLDLGQASGIGDLDLQSNAGSSSVTLPNLSFTGRLQVNAGSIELCTPAGAGLRVRTGESIVGSYDLAGEGLVQDGRTWETPGFASAAVRIDLTAEANAGSITLNPEDGCDG
jgi:hypothetical protein